MGVVTKLVAEYRKRPTKFMLELDLVFANVIMSLLADVMLIWIPAPRASVSIQKAYCHDGPSQQQCSLSRWLKGCPDNAFQVSFHPCANCHALYTQVTLTRALLFCIAAY